VGTDINCFKEYRDRAGNWHFVAEGPYPNCQNFRWKETVKELIESSYLELERFLAATAKRRKLSADDVRTVFWFDS